MENNLKELIRETLIEGNIPASEENIQIVYRAHLNDSQDMPIRLLCGTLITELNKEKV